MNPTTMTPEEMAAYVRQFATQLIKAERHDLLLSALGSSLLKELCIEVAKVKLSPLVITPDYRFLLPAYDKEIDLSPIHKAVYLLFLNHPEGIEFKHLSDHEKELYHWYKETSNHNDISKVTEGVARLINPLDNAINEKCSRIKRAFTDIMDEYSASYYIISSHARQPISGSSKIWYKRLKIISLPRELVTFSQNKNRKHRE